MLALGCWRCFWTMKMSCVGEGEEGEGREDWGSGDGFGG